MRFVRTLACPFVITSITDRRAFGFQSLPENLRAHLFDTLLRDDIVLAGALRVLCVGPDLIAASRAGKDHDFFLQQREEAASFLELLS